MNYEKLYKDALKRAKYALTTDMDNSGHWAVNYIFPELKEKESEDERIRYEIIAFLEQSIHRGGGTPIPQEQEDKWIAWLEKQKGLY